MVPPVSTSRGYNNWRAEEIACLRYAQEHLAMLDIKVAVSLAFAVKYNASISDPEVLSLSSQACRVLGEADHPFSSRYGAEKMSHIKVFCYLACAARAACCDALRVEIAQALYARRWRPYLDWSEPDSELCWLAIWATGHAGLNDRTRHYYMSSGFPATFAAQREVWLSAGSIDMEAVDGMAYSVLMHLKHPAVDAPMIRWLGSNLTAQRRHKWIAAWRRAVNRWSFAPKVRACGLVQALYPLCAQDPLAVRLELLQLLTDLGEQASEDHLIGLLPECGPAQQLRLVRTLEKTGTRASIAALSSIDRLGTPRATRHAARQAIDQIKKRLPVDPELAGAVSLASADTAGALTLSSGAQTRGAISLAARVSIFAAAARPLVKKPRVTALHVAALLLCVACLGLFYLLSLIFLV